MWEEPTEGVRPTSEPVGILSVQGEEDVNIVIFMLHGVAADVEFWKPTLKSTGTRLLRKRRLLAVWTK